MRVETDPEIDMRVDDGDEVQMRFGEGFTIVNHPQLLGRDENDQHPISAITGLEEALAEAGEMMVVNITGTSPNFVADKTYAEISEAIPNVVAKIWSSYYSLHSVSASVFHEIVFQGVLLGGEGDKEVVEHQIIIYDDNSVGVRTTARESPSKTSQLQNDSGYITANDIPQEVFLVDLYLTSTNPLAGICNKGAEEIYEASAGGKVPIMRVIDIAHGWGGIAQLVYVMADNDSYLAQFAYTQQLEGGFSPNYFIVSILDNNTPNFNAVQTSPWITGIDSRDVTTALGYTPYQKPTNGIPDTDLTQAIRTSLGKADTALQGITSADVTTALGYTPYNATNPNGYVTHDNQVEQGYISNPSSYSYWRGLAIGANAVASESGALSTTTDKVYVADAIRVQPSTGTIKATTFKGDLTGTASGNLVASDLIEATDADVIAIVV